MSGEKNSQGKGPMRPVAPDGMEILFFYKCPFCGRHVPMVSPTRPGMAKCDACGRPFPILPVDERGQHFIRIMMAGGRAAVDPDFI